jgi:8-oxo-dGTP pyrophosphatase MutT (NUDIX family)
VQDEHRIIIECGETSYKDFMGSTWPDVPEKHRRLALGVLAVTLSSDNFLILGVRSPRIDWGTLRHVVPAGRMRPDEGSPHQAILKEYQEEAGLRPADLASLRCVGVLSDKTWGRLNMEIVYLSHSNLSAMEISQKSQQAASNWEHCQIEPFPWEPNQIRSLLLTDPAGYVPTGWAAVGLCLRRQFGLQAFPDWLPQGIRYHDHMGRRLEMTSDSAPRPDADKKDR